jgi:hypothetical protein
VAFLSGAQPVADLLRFDFSLCEAACLCSKQAIAAFAFNMKSSNP